MPNPLLAIEAMYLHAHTCIYLYITFLALQVFRFGTKYGKPADGLIKKHTYILEPVSGNAKYSKQRPNEFADSGQPLHKAAVNLDDVTLCLPKVHFHFHFLFLLI